MPQIEPYFIGGDGSKFDHTKDDEDYRLAEEETSEAQNRLSDRDVDRLMDIFEEGF